jgi:hypothetical protein
MQGRYDEIAALASHLSITSRAALAAFRDQPLISHLCQQQCGSLNYIKVLVKIQVYFFKFKSSVQGPHEGLTNHSTSRHI